jgi:hypothetical protein
MKNVYIANGTSVHAINSLADWIRQTVVKAQNGQFDVIRFIEVDLRTLFPNLYVHIVDDSDMGASRAYIQQAPLSIILSESIYDGACGGCLFSTETILHEVGHLILHHKYASDQLNASSAQYENQIRGMSYTHSAEWQATMFAICLLFPYHDSKELSWESFLEKFGGSRRQYDRYKRHIVRLKMRENERRISDEKRWVERIIKKLPRNSDAVGLNGPVQLSLFASLKSGYSSQRATLPS